MPDDKKKFIEINVPAVDYWDEVPAEVMDAFIVIAEHYYPYRNKFRYGTIKRAKGPNAPVERILHRLGTKREGDQQCLTIKEVCPI